MKKQANNRHAMEMEQHWWTYKVEGMTLEEILKTKPTQKGKALVWSKEKGWEEKE